MKNPQQVSVLFVSALGAAFLAAGSLSWAVLMGEGPKLSAEVKFKARNYVCAPQKWNGPGIYTVFVPLKNKAFVYYRTPIYMNERGQLVAEPAAIVSEGSGLPPCTESIAIGELFNLPEPSTKICADLSRVETNDRVTEEEIKQSFQYYSGLQGGC